jgi:predicted transcriptional regulator
MSDKDDLPEKLTIRLSTKVRQRLEEMADADERPVSAVARRIVLRALREDGGEAA